jgi:hypothetical protein
MSTITSESRTGAPQGQEGFSLVEVLIAIVVLVFGIISVANLMVVAAANNMTANQGSAAVTAGIQQMEQLKSMPFDAVPRGRNVVVVGTTAGPDDRAVGAVHIISKVDNVPGAVGTIFITVIATPISGLNARSAIDPANPPNTRSQVVFTSFRTSEGL